VLVSHMKGRHPFSCDEQISRTALCGRSMHTGQRTSSHSAASFAAAAEDSSDRREPLLRPCGDKFAVTVAAEDSSVRQETLLPPCEEKYGEPRDRRLSEEATRELLSFGIVTQNQ
jgi:hypothetical protein